MSVFISHYPCKNPRMNYLLFFDKHKGRVVIAFRIHISEFTRRNRFKMYCLKPFLSTPEHRTVTVILRCNLHAYLFLKCWQVFKRTILHNCSTAATGNRKRRKACKHLKWLFIMAAAGMQYNFKMCIINRYIHITI